MNGTVRVQSVVWFVTGVVMSLVATVIVVQAWRVDAAPGDADATLVPITPCRLVDTRKPGGAALQAGEVRTIDAHGTNGPIPGSQCTIPSDAVGLSMNVTALDATAITYWTIWADGTAQPEASSVNPAPGQPPTPNAVTTPISNAGRFKVFNFAGSVHMLIDVNGYYTTTSLSDLASRLTAVEANVATNTGGIANNTAGIAALDAAQPFTIASDPVHAVTAESTATEIRSVTVQAPVAGHVAVVASGDMAEGTDGQYVRCGVMDSVTNPPGTVAVLWQSPTGGDVSHLSASRVFDIAAGATATYSLVCNNNSSGSSHIYSPRVTAIFTPAP